MIFTKMQLNGNDFIYVNCLKTNITSPVSVSCETCSRNFGIGADGLVLIKPSDKADYKIEIFNSDGSKALMCGNALLLLGRYLFESEDFKSEIKDKLDNIIIETDSGIRNISLETEYDEILYVSANLGKIEFKDNYLNFDNKIIIKNNSYDINYLSVGNPHGVVILDGSDDIDNIKLCDLIKNNSGLEKIITECNIEIIKIIDENKIKIKIFERGVGETLSCGSGACAAVSVATKKNLCEKEKEIKVSSKGGDHWVKYMSENLVILKAKPELVYNGYLRI